MNNYHFSHHYNLCIIYKCIYYYKHYSFFGQSTWLGPTQNITKLNYKHNTFPICYYRPTTEICMLLPMSGCYQCGLMWAGGIIQFTHPVQQRT